MSLDRRIIPAELAQAKGIEAFPFPYFAATFKPDMADLEHDGEDSIGAQLTSVDEDTQRMASVDQQIFEKLRQAEVQAQEIARKAYEEGFSSGEVEGRAFGESQYKAYMQRLDGGLADISASLSLLNKAAEDELLALVLSCAEYLAGREILAALDGAKPLLERILSVYPDLGSGEQGRISIFLNPKDLEVLGNRFMAYTAVTLAEDPELNRGSLRVSTPEGILEATLERRKERLLKLVERWAENRPEDPGGAERGAP